MRLHLLEQKHWFSPCFDIQIGLQKFKLRGPWPLVVNIKLLLIAVVRMCSCDQKMLKKWINRLCVIVFIIGSISIWGEAEGLGPMIKPMV